MADLSQIEILVGELERLFISLNNSLRTGTAEDGLTEVKVSKALLADSAKVLRSKDGSSSKDLTDITNDINNFIAAIEVDPTNAKKHEKISAYLEGKYLTKVVDAAYERVLGNAEDKDSIINTFKELQEVIGATETTGNTGLTSIFNRLSDLSGAITDVQDAIDTQSKTLTDYVNGEIERVEKAYKAADSGIQGELDDLKADLTSYTSSNDSRNSTNEGLLSGLRQDVDGNHGEFKTYRDLLGTSSKIVPAIGRLASLKVSTLWKVTI